MAHIPPRCPGASHVVAPEPRSRRRSRVAVLCLLLLFVPGAVQAQTLERVPDEVPELALELYRRGEAALNEGRYREACRWFEQALILDPHSAGLTYQVAVVHERLGDLRKAVNYYERYLDRLSLQDAEERLRIRDTLRRLRAALRPSDATETNEGETLAPLLVRQSAPATESALVTTPTDDTSPRAPLVWTVAGGGVGLLMAGALTGVWAARKQTNADEVLGPAPSTVAQDPRGLRAQANRLAVAADILLGAGALSVGIALVLLWAAPSASDAPQFATLADDGVALNLAF